MYFRENGRYEKKLIKYARSNWPWGLGISAAAAFRLHSAGSDSMLPEWYFSMT